MQDEFLNLSAEAAAQPWHALEEDGRACIVPVQGGTLTYEMEPPREPGEERGESEVKWM